MEEGRLKMHSVIDKYGIDSVEALEISSELDLVIIEVQREKLKEFKVKMENKYAE